MNRKKNGSKYEDIDDEIRLSWKVKNKYISVIYLPLEKSEEPNCWHMPSVLGEKNKVRFGTRHETNDIMFWRWYELEILRGNGLDELIKYGVGKIPKKITDKQTILNNFFTKKLNKNQASVMS